MKYYETFAFDGIGYQKLFHSRNWRIAMLNFIDELKIDRIDYVECHQETDEAFVLLQGRASLFFAEENQGKIERFVCLPLEFGKVYRVPAGVYHSHTLSEDAKLLVVEEENTGYHNSPRIYLTPADRSSMAQTLQEVNRGI
jgi:cupin superfamily acireductone dioxygenase involved in methionine salvage